MLPHLSEIEARVIGCLMEKSVVTPDQYPLTLNSLTNACNQKSARNPVMSLPQNEVQRTARGLRDKSLVSIEENFRTGVEKYKQRLCNTPFSDRTLDAAQFAVLTVLLLRGPQTPGELRAHSGRLHSFADNDAVVAAANELISDEEDSLLVRLPRTPGRRDAEFMHQLSGPIDTADYAEAAAAEKGGVGTGRTRIAELEQRIRELEQENAKLRARLEGEGQPE